MNKILFAIWRYIKKEIFPVLTIPRILAHLSIFPLGILLILLCANFILPGGDFSWPSYIFDGLLFVLIRIYSWIYVTIYSTIGIIFEFFGLGSSYRFSDYPIQTYITALVFMVFIIPHIVLWMYWKKNYKNFCIMLAIYLLIPCIGCLHTIHFRQGYNALSDLCFKNDIKAVFPMEAQTFYEKCGKPVFWILDKQQGWTGYYLHNVSAIRITCRDGLIHPLLGASNWPD